MKKMQLLVALATGLVTSAAMAQVTVYGIVDTGVEWLSHSNAAGQSVSKVPGLGGSLPSRVGFKGSEDLGGGLRAIFQLENGFSPDTGALNQGGRLFGRQAYVGLASDAWGAVTVGRLYDMTYLVQAKADTFGGNLYSIGSLDGYLPNARTDNALGYMGTFGRWTLGATYSFGRDASPAGATGPSGVAPATNCPGEKAGDAQACRQTTMMVDYDAKSYGVAASYDVLHGGAGELNGLTNSNFKDRRTALMAFAIWGTTRIGTGIIDRKTSKLTDGGSTIYFLGASYPLTPQVTLDAQVSRIAIKNSPNAATMILARATYYLSKRTSVYLMGGRIGNTGTSTLSIDASSVAGPGLSQVGAMTGVRVMF